MIDQSKNYSQIEYGATISDFYEQHFEAGHLMQRRLLATQLMDNYYPF